MPDIAYTCLMQYKLFTRLSLYTLKYFKRVDISASLPDLKSSLSDHLPTAVIAEANKEVLKAVAEAKEPQKKGPYIKFTLGKS